MEKGQGYNMSKRTALYELHKQAGAQLVDFAGWDMPLNYGSQLQEHRDVREHVGIFDVSHMGVVAVTGAQATDYLRSLLANDAAKLKEAGHALYSCMLNQTGGIIDDLIAYRISDTDYRIVINAGRREEDMQWMQTQAQAQSFEASITLLDNTCILALQGPEAIDHVCQLFPEHTQTISALKPFKAIVNDECIIARTGYTGEDGVEMVVTPEQAQHIWQHALNNGVKPCGLGARDTLRLEAGLNLYGSDMNEDTSPLESNLAWTVSWKDEARDFIGKQALLAQKQQGLTQQLVGVVMLERGVMRDHQKIIIDGVGEGEITSGSFSPSLQHSIALARVPINAGSRAFVERRGQRIPVHLIKPPFIRRGKKVFNIENNMEKMS